MTDFPLGGIIRCQLKVASHQETGKLRYINYIEDNKTGGIITHFEVTSPDSTTKFVSPFFTKTFIDDYLGVPGDGNITENRNRIVNEKQELLKLWGLVRIEELINQESLEAEPEISSEDFEWAKKVEKGDLRHSSSQQNANEYIYISERRIGF